MIWYKTVESRNKVLRERESVFNFQLLESMKNCSLGRLGKGAIKFCINYIHYRNLHCIKIPLEVGRFSSFFILSKLSAWLRLGLISIFIRIGWSNIEGSRSHMGRWTSKKLRYYPHIIMLQRYKNPDRRAIPSPLECNDSLMNIMLQVADH